MSAQAQPLLTPEQYLELERASDVRCEYYQGHVTAMAGGSLEHGRIIANLSARLLGLLRERGTPRCAVVTSDLRTQVAPDGLYTYPDIVVVCGDPQFVDNRRDTVANPVLLIEVLSASTEAYDRGFKAQQYRQVPSLKEYALRFPV